MLEIFFQSLAFLFQAAVVVVAILIVVGFIFSLASRGKDSAPLKITVLNKKYQKMKNQIQAVTLGKKDQKKRDKTLKKGQDSLVKKPKAFVINFQGDMKASSVDALSEEISAILMVAKPEDQVIAKIESPGGVVHGYGFAASQLQRVVSAKIPLIACVDKVAASGGYMMASVADSIYAAPFAILGSIGVVASIPNINRLLEKNNVDYLEITAGEHKRTITPLGKITDQGMEKFKAQLEDIHTLFKSHVSQRRKKLDLSKVATGEYWFGIRAKELDLVDELMTSDEYIGGLTESHQIIEVKHQPKKNLKDKIAQGLNTTLHNIIEKNLERFSLPQFF